MQTIPLTTSITPLLNNQTNSPTPTILLYAASTFSPTAPPVQAVYFQVDTWQGKWMTAAARPSVGPLSDWPWSSQTRRPYCILNVLGDVLDDGEVRFVGATKTLKAARRCIKARGESRLGEFVIYNQETGERMPIKGEGEGAVPSWLRRATRLF